MKIYSSMCLYPIVTLPTQPVPKAGSITLNETFARAMELI